MGTRGPEEMDGPFTMALLALRGCSHVNGVSRLHGKVSRRLFGIIIPAGRRKKCLSDM